MAIDPEVLRLAEILAIGGYALWERFRTRRTVLREAAAQTQVIVDHVSAIERQVSPDPESTHPGQTVREMLRDEAAANRSFRAEIRDLVQSLTVRVEAGEADENVARKERAELLVRVVALETELGDVKKRLIRLEPPTAEVVVS